MTTWLLSWPSKRQAGMHLPLHVRFEAQSSYHRLNPSMATSGHDEKSAVTAPAFATGLDPTGSRVQQAVAHLCYL